MNDFRKNDDLIAVVQVFRHGQRIPMDISYPTDPYRGNFFGNSELTNIGKRQMYELGQYTRNRYEDFLPVLYSKKDYQIFNTEQERTVISAQLFSAGLYPPTESEIWNEDIKWNPIPTNMTEQSIFRSYPRSFCPAYSKAIQVVWADLLKEAKKDSMSEYVALHSGITLNNFLSLGYVHDALTVQEAVGLKLPEWTEAVYSRMPYRFDFLKSVVCNDEFRKFVVGRFLYELMKHFEKMAENPSSGQKLIAYSGHDVNIYSLLNTLEMFQDENFPEYASSLFFELRKKKEESYVSVYYVNNGTEYPIPICGGEVDYTLSQFRSLLERFLITENEFYEKCAL